MSVMDIWASGDDRVRQRRLVDDLPPGPGLGVEIDWDWIDGVTEKIVRTPAA